LAILGILELDEDYNQFGSRQWRRIKSEETSKNGIQKHENCFRPFPALVAYSLLKSLTDTEDFLNLRTQARGYSSLPTEATTRGRPLFRTPASSRDNRD